ncbi:MAG: HAD family hydrolase [Chitinophagaceae bacterium]|jgi:2-haloacid dehalogenase
MIDTIIFDLGGVLIDWQPDHMYKKIIKDEQQRKWFLETICTMEWNEQQDGGRTIQEANNELITQYPEHRELILAYYERWEEMLVGPILPTVELFKNIKSSGKYKLYALTNWSAETFPRALELFDFLHWFDGRVVSGEEKTRKPYKEIYDIILNRFSLSPQKTLFIDDNIKNINAAKEIGINCIHFSSPEQLTEELKNKNIFIN